MKPLIAAALMLLPIHAPAFAQGRPGGPPGGGPGFNGPHGQSGDPFRPRRGDQDDAYHGHREGGLRALRDIENSLVPRMKQRGADYIGAEFDNAESRYRLKFMRNGSVIWLDVDGRTGSIIGRAGD